MLRCDVCKEPATHCCSGLDSPAVYFCEQHGKEHKAARCCHGTLVKMGATEPSKETKHD